MQWAAYPHIDDTVLVNLDNVSDDTLVCSVLSCKSAVTGLKLCLSGGVPVLIVGTVGGVQVWEPSQGTRIASITLPHSNSQPVGRMPYAIGFTIVKRDDGSSVLIAGTSSGELHAIEADGYKFVYTEVLNSSHAECIAGPLKAISDALPPYAHVTFAYVGPMG